MRFEKFHLPTSKKIPFYIEKKFSTKRRYAAAKRAVEKQKKKWGLFYDELAEFKSPEERISQNIQKYTDIYLKERKEQYLWWKKARKMYFSLPRDIKFMSKKLFESGSFGGLEPFRFCDLMDSFLSNPESHFYLFRITVLKNTEIIKEDGKLQRFYRYLLQRINNRFGKVYHNMGYYKGFLYFTVSKGHQIKKLNSEEEAKVISALNSFYSTFNSPLVKNRIIKKIVYLEIGNFESNLKNFLNYRSEC